MDDKLRQTPSQAARYRATGLSSCSLDSSHGVVINPEPLSHEESNNFLFGAPNEVNSCQDSKPLHFSFEDDSFIEASFRKVVKQTAELTYVVSETTSKKTTKRGKKSKKIEAQPAAEEKETVDYSYVEYTPSFKVDKGYLKMELIVKNVPFAIEKIDNEEAKNYLKNLGDALIDDLIAKRVIEKHQLRKDCLNSLPIWNSLFNLDKRMQNASKRGNIGKFLAELNDLQEKITPQDWISYFMDFAVNFNVEAHRTSSIQSEERKNLYEFLSRNLKEAVTAFYERLQSVGLGFLNISAFQVKKIYKDKVAFLFQVDSSSPVKSLVEELNNSFIVGVKPTAIKKDLMEEESEDLVISFLEEKVFVENDTQPSNSNVVECFSKQIQQQEEESEIELPPLPGLEEMLAVSWAEFVQAHPDMQNNRSFERLPSRQPSFWLENVVNYQGSEFARSFDF